MIRPIQNRAKAVFAESGRTHRIAEFCISVLVTNMIGHYVETTMLASSENA